MITLSLLPGRLAFNLLGFGKLLVDFWLMRSITHSYKPSRIQSTHVQEIVGRLSVNAIDNTFPFLLSMQWPAQNNKWVVNHKLCVAPARDYSNAVSLMGSWTNERGMMKPGDDGGLPCIHSQC